MLKYGLFAVKNTGSSVIPAFMAAKRTSSDHICVAVICLFCCIHFTVTSVQQLRIKGKNPNAYTTFCQVLIYCYCSCNIRGRSEHDIFVQWDHGWNRTHALSFGRFSLKNKHKMQMLSSMLGRSFRFMIVLWGKVAVCVCVRVCMPVTGYRACVCLWARWVSILVNTPPCL